MLLFMANGRLNCRPYSRTVLELPAAQSFMHFFLAESGKPHKKIENKKNCQIGLNGMRCELVLFGCKFRRINLEFVK